MSKLKEEIKELVKMEIKKMREADMPIDEVVYFDYKKSPYETFFAIPHKTSFRFALEQEGEKGKRIIAFGQFSDKEKANKVFKDMIKKYELKRGQGFWYNISKHLELHSSF